MGERGHKERDERGRGEGLTAKMLTMPKILVRMPAEITQRHIGVPRDICDVASLFRLPRMDTPRVIIMRPRVTKPDVGDRRGQLSAM